MEVDGSVVMIGGINAGTIPSTLRYTPNSDTWCRLPDVPSFGILSPRMLLFPTGGAGFVNGDFNISLR
ncbi:galactose oxidase, central domain protein [Leptospira interrogans str. UT126]|nr:galactose oxidase, central domain protein [Leptospira interrogans str. UT126]